jgi:polysaccharide export outer membrane protein
MSVFKLKRRIYLALSLLVLSTFFFSCVSNKKIAYLKDVPDSTAGFNVSEDVYTDPLIQPDDIMSITIQTIDPQTSVLISQIPAPIPSVGTSSASSIGGQVVTGFLVDRDGIVELPMIGKIKLGGMSTFQARDLIGEKASRYFKNPTVQVRYANYKITVLGEVAKPGTYTIPNEKASILDIIGLAGDLTIFGKRENVLLIRESGKKKDFARFDLNSSNIFKSPYFYLKQNDIIYVEPNKAKVATTNAARTQAFTIIISVLSFFIIIATRVSL